MKYYAVVQLKIHDHGWTADYTLAVDPLVEKHGGKFLARTNIIERIEGEGGLPDGVVLIEWPSKEAAESFYNDPAYAPHLKARLAGATGDFFLVAGDDMTKS